MSTYKTTDILDAAAAAVAFPGERYLRVQLPDYEEAEKVVSGALILSFVFWILMLPIWLRHPANKLQRDSSSSCYSSCSTHKNGHSKKPTTKTATTGPEALAGWVIPLLSVVGFLTTTVVVVAFVSPYNVWLSRRVFEAPVFSEQECADIVARSMAAAQRNAQQAQAILLAEQEIMKDDEKRRGSSNITTTAHQNGDNKNNNIFLESLLKEPAGWQKMRHGFYPTTDLNLVQDPYTDEDRTFISDLLNRRVAPLLSRIYGIPQGSLRANDLFVIRYDSDKKNHLETHEDDGDISFNILLTSDFEGGGTRFYKRTGRNVGADHMELVPFAHVAPTEPGTLLSHTALLQHEGFYVLRGTRIILVGFLAVDRENPWTRAWTGLSWLASYANFNWMTVQTKQDGFTNKSRQKLLAAQQQGGGESRRRAASWSSSMNENSLLRQVFDRVKAWLDLVCVHQVENLVSSDKKVEFLKALDQGYRPQSNQASWFEGQESYLQQNFASKTRPGPKQIDEF